LWDLFGSEGGGRRDSCLGKENLVFSCDQKLKMRSFRYYEERVTEEVVSPRADQQSGKLVL
jgi:hypothetical protein